MIYKVILGSFDSFEDDSEDEDDSDEEEEKKNESNSCYYKRNWPCLEVFLARFPVFQLNSQTRLEALACFFMTYGFLFTSLSDMSRFLSLIGPLGRCHLRIFPIEDAFSFGPRPAEITVPLTEMVGRCEGLRKLEVWLSDGEVVCVMKELDCRGKLMRTEATSGIPVMKALMGLEGGECWCGVYGVGN